MTLKQLANKINSWKIIIGAIGIIALIVTTSFALDNRWAKQIDFLAFTNEYYIDKSNDKIDRLQERIWKTEDRIHQIGQTQELKEQLRHLKTEKQKEEDRLKRLEKRFNGR